MNRPGIALSALMCWIACSLSLVGSANSQTDVPYLGQSDPCFGVSCEEESMYAPDEAFEDHGFTECDVSATHECAEEAPVCEAVEEEFAGVDFDDDGCYYEPDWNACEAETMVQDVVEEEVPEPGMDEEDSESTDIVEYEYGGYDYEYYEDAWTVDETEVADVASDAVTIDEEPQEPTPAVDAQAEAVDEMDDYGYESEYDYYDEHYVAESLVDEAIEMIEEDDAVTIDQEVVETAPVEEEAVEATDEMTEFDFESEYGCYYFDDDNEEAPAAEACETVENETVEPADETSEYEYEYDYESDYDFYYDFYYHDDDDYGREEEDSWVAEEAEVVADVATETNEGILESEEIDEEEVETFDEMNEYEYLDDFEYYESYGEMVSDDEVVEVMEEEVDVNAEEETLEMDAGDEAPVDESSDFYYESEYDYYGQYYDEDYWAAEQVEASEAVESDAKDEVAAAEELIEEEELADAPVGSHFDEYDEYDDYYEDAWVMESQPTAPEEDVVVESSEPANAESETESLGYDAAYDEAMFGESAEELEPIADPVNEEIFEPIDPVLPVSMDADAAAERLKSEVIAFTARTVNRLRVVVKDAASKLHTYAVAELPAMASLLKGETRR